ncbi:MAG: type V CRISPR-associated protein Cas12a/Cpf1 [Bacteroidales bacterium]
MRQFTNLYKQQKTLRFELKPMGKTLQNIKKHGLIEQDEKRADDYKRVKEIIDDYHRAFIERSLATFGFSVESLQKFEEAYLSSEETDKLQADLRKELVSCLTKADDYSTLYKKELIKDDLSLWMKKQVGQYTDEDFEKVKSFEKFTTYFTGFNDNRKNIYSEDGKSTAISYRIVHENLPKFIDNVQVFGKIQSNYPELHTRLKEAYTGNGLSALYDGMSLCELFDVGSFNKAINQSGIDSYNTVIGGVSHNENEERTQGLNEIINLYNQQLARGARKVPRFAILYKQILSDKNTLSFRFDEIKDDNQLLELLKQFNDKMQGLPEQLEKACKMLNICDAEHIYIDTAAISNISHSYFGNHAIIRQALIVSIPDISKKNEKARETAVNKVMKGVVSIAELERIVNTYVEHEEELAKGIKLNLSDYFINAKYNSNKLYEQIKETSNSLSSLLNNKTEQITKDDKTRLQNWLDAYMDMLHFLKPLTFSSDNYLEKDSAFYDFFEPLYEQLQEIVGVYNKTRNHLTKKPYRTEKIKLNFENATLANGWDRNKETDNTALILIKDSNYYLAIMNKKHNKLFQESFETDSESLYQKMIYKLLPGPNKMLPKVFMSKKGIEEFKPSSDILDKYQKGTHKKGANFSLKDCHCLIDFFKDSISKHRDWNSFGFKFSPTNTYSELSDFYKEVETQGYYLDFTNVPAHLVDKWVEDGKLYLFQIWNKDFSTHSKGKKNLHTMYWEALFSKENLSDVVYKLNGAAEIFWREASLKPDVIHPKGESIKNKNPQTHKKESKFNYDLVKNKRYTEDKFQFHVPITMNFKSGELRNNDFNNKVHEYLRSNENVNIIGIDRGERHLLYISVVNPKGEIIHQESLNTITNEYKSNGQTTQVKFDYHKKLDEQEKARQLARKSWQQISTIKELKEGYLSHVVHKIATLMMKYNAIIALEDLNFGFKRGRFKVEKQVYQKFEKALIDKLNYLVFKDKDINEVGGLLKALQLSSKFESFSKLGKQSGFIFYTQAAYTSKIDPTTGFVNALNPKYSNLISAQHFFKEFDNIRWNDKEQYFEFSFDYSKLTSTKKRDLGVRTDWTICSFGDERYKWDRTLNNNKGDYVKYNVTYMLASLFIEKEINYKDGSNIKDKIVEQADAKFHKDLIFCLSLLLQMRNSATINGEVHDFILSPVQNYSGEFYDSRNYQDNNAKLPKDADANGAYCIALKGLMLVDRIREGETKPKLAISNGAWFEYIQKKTASK